MTDVSTTDTPAITGSLEERAALTSGQDMWSTVGIPGVLPQLVLSDGPHGLRVPKAGGFMLESEPATCYPPAVTLGSSWNPELATEVGVAIGVEARAAGVNVVLGPGLNIKRSPLNGRNFEYFSEDPHVTAQMGAALVRGIQSQGVGATIKHFAANNQETDRMRVSAQVDDRALREIYLAAFEQIVREAAPYAVMSAYNRLNGVYTSHDRWLLSTVLREEWGFDGLVMSDWGAVNDRVAALAAGLDLEMPPSGTDDQIVAAVREGTLDPVVLDLAAERLAQLAARTTGSDEPLTLDLDAHHQLARRVAAQSLVLLKNEGVLPLDPAGEQRIAVIGEFARTPRIQGGGSSKVVPTQLTSALEALTSTLSEAGSPATLEFEAGFLLSGEAEPQLQQAAVRLARGADVALVFLGLPDAKESEGSDRTGIELPAVQLELLTELVATGTPLVVVLSNGAVVDVASWQADVAALLEAWLPGQAGGAAIADVLLGTVSPSGRLTETIPLRLQDSPSYLSFPGANGLSVYGESIYVGYRYYDTREQPVAYPFGFGLSYSSFSYADLRLTAGEAANSWTVEFTVTNTGDRAAAEVAQVYVGVDEEHPSRPVHELRGFRKVFLEPGETQKLTVALGARDFALWDAREQRWSVLAGTYRIEVGASARDLRLTGEVTSAGDGYHAELTEDSTVAEWLADPHGLKQLQPIFGAMAERAADVPPELLAMVFQMPLIKLSTFGMGLDRETIARAVIAAAQDAAAQEAAS